VHFSGKLFSLIVLSDLVRSVADPDLVGSGRLGPDPDPVLDPGLN
jgi:hypothetical protein